MRCLIRVFTVCIRINAPAIPYMINGLVLSIRIEESTWQKRVIFKIVCVYFFAENTRNFILFGKSLPKVVLSDFGIF